MIDITDPNKINKYVKLYNKSLLKAKRNSKILFFIPGIISILLIALMLIFAISNINVAEYNLVFMVLSATVIGVIGTMTLEKMLKNRLNYIIDVKKSILYFIEEYEKEEFIYPALKEQYLDGYVNDSFLEKI